MKKLTIIRHAKSDWSFDVPDMDRPISKRGKNDAQIMAELIDTINCFPQIIYSSPSKRTVETYEYFLKYSSVFKNIEFQKSNQLYDFSGYNVLEFIMFGLFQNPIAPPNGFSPKPIEPPKFNLK